MSQLNVIKDNHFERIDQVRLDSKNRITLKKKSGISEIALYIVYRNGLGQIILDPQATIPAYEQWLFKNKVAKERVLRGLDDAKKGHLVDADEDFSKYLDKD
jgi:hypothetical protein